MKMLKELKGKLTYIEWSEDRVALKYRLEDYCEMTDGFWIKLRSVTNPKQMTWYRFSQVESIGRVP